MFASSCTVGEVLKTQDRCGRDDGVLLCGCAVSLAKVVGDTCLTNNKSGRQVAERMFNCPRSIGSVDGSRAVEAELVSWLEQWP